ncbi:hypothetical protein ABZ860_06255 [Microbispora sp. NPDC046973]|uniref:hypothetical protein n=1 Tax=Microbispora sp. NPDC046973 TaxID=3155022 RepID=UPI0033D74629
MAYQQGPFGQRPHHPTPPHKTEGLGGALVVVAFVALGLAGCSLLGLVAWMFGIGGIGAQGAIPHEQPTCPAATPAATEGAKAEHTLVFEADSRNGASPLGAVIYSPAAGATSGGWRTCSVRFPFSATVGVDGPLPGLGLTVFSDDVKGEVIGRIKVDGTVVCEASGPSEYGASCSRSADG